VTLTVQVNPGVPTGTDILNTANVVWSDGGTSYGPVSADWHATAYTEPKLAITKFGPDQSMVDSTITYTGTVSNVGGSTAHNVTLVDYLPPGVTFVDSSHATYSIETNTVTWHLGDLPAGASVPGWLTVHIALNTPDGTVLTDTFNVTAQDSDPATASWDTLAHTSPLLVIEKTGTETAYPNGTVYYTIKVTNIGGSAASNVAVMDDLPVGFSYQSSTPAGMNSGGIIMWNLGSIPVSGSVEIGVSATVEQGFPNHTVLINTAGVFWEDPLARTYGPVFGTADTTINQASGAIVGWQVHPVNKLVILAPWIALALVTVIGLSLFVLRRRRA